LAPEPTNSLTPSGEGDSAKVETGCGALYVTLNDLENNPFELFLTMGKSGGCASCMCESIGRMVSATLRGGLGLDVAKRQLTGISCHSSGNGLLSCPSAIVKALEMIHADNQSQHKGVPGD